MSAVKRFLKPSCNANASTECRDDWGYTPLHQAARQGQLSMCKKLLKEGADINAATPEGWTALHLAATFASKEVVQLLLSKGANVDTRDKLVGFSPLCQAASEGRKEIVEILLAGGADINISDMSNQTPLIHATVNKHKEVAEILREHSDKFPNSKKASDIRQKLPALKNKIDEGESRSALDKTRGKI